MKRIAVLTTLATLLLTGLTGVAKGDTPVVPEYVSQRTFSTNSLADPENAFWPTMFWWWNGTLEPELLRNQLADMKAHDFRNTLIWPIANNFRPADYHMSPDYLTPEFFDRVQGVVNEAQQLGMSCVLYDDGAWPSGSAVRRHPQYATNYATVQLVYNNGSWTQVRNTSTKITGDYLSPQTTQAFIDITHEPYAATVGSHFGSTIKSMFTDELAYQYVNVGHSIPWTPNGQTLFQNQFGYDVLADGKLDAFAVSPSQLTTEQKQVRVDVIDFVSGQYRDAFLLTKRDWCRQQGIAQTGHVAAADDTMGAVKYGFGNALRQLRAMDIPGVDAVWRRIFPGQQTENNFPKFASSAAHQNGTALSLTESFGVYGQGLTPAQTKWVIDYQYVRGINTYCGNNYPITSQDHSMTAERPRGGPTLEPMWDYLPALNGYIARLGYTMACGQPDIDVGLYYPVRDIWANGESSDPAVQGFNTLTQALLERQCDYDMIDDDILNDPATRVENGRLVLGAMSYRTIVVGPTSWMTATAQQRLNEFQAAGGQVIHINSLEQINSAIADISPTIELSVASSDIRAAKRSWAGGGTVFFFNEGQNTYNGMVTVELDGIPYQVDPDTGLAREVNYQTLPDGKLSLSLNLTAGESMLLVAQPSEDIPEDLAPSAKRTPLESLVIANGWNARVDRRFWAGEHDFEIHENENAQFEPVSLGRWATTLGLTSDFSGHVTYQCMVDIPESMRDGELMLDLGEMEYAARVKINGEDIGCVLWNPFTIDLPSLGDSSQFLLEIEMSNTLANELTSQRVMDLWEEMEDQPGWGSISRYNDDCVQFEMESRGGGLLGPVTLHQLEAPEPCTSLLLGIALVCLPTYSRRKK